MKCTAEDPTGTVEGQTRGDVCCFQVRHGAAPVAREMGMEAAFVDYVFVAGYDSYVSTLSGLNCKCLIERAADIAFEMEVLLLRLRQVLNHWQLLLSKLTGNEDS